MPIVIELNLIGNNMIIIEMELGERPLVTFQCPECGAIDVSYNQMPDKCYNCEHIYTFDVEDLITSSFERKNYYLLNETSSKAIKI